MKLREGAFELLIEANVIPCSKLAAMAQKLDIDKDGFVELDHVVGLVKEEGLGTIIDDEAQSIIGQGREIKQQRPRKEDIVQES